MDLVFKALASATRRRLLDRLFEGPGQTLGELCTGLDMRRQSVTKHLHILEEAGLVTVNWQGREKHHYLNAVPIADIGSRWIDKFARAQADAVISLKRALENRKPPKSGKDSET